MENFPIPTTDFVLRRKEELLLIKRNEGAYAGEWFVLGGRQNRGEKMLDAVRRVADREVGLKPKDVEAILFSHCQDVFNPASTNSDGELPAWHSIWHFYLIEVSDSFEPQLDTTSSECMWFRVDDLPAIPDVVAEALMKAGL